MKRHLIKHPFLKILIVNKQLKDISVKDRNMKTIGKHQNTSTVKFTIKTNCTLSLISTLLWRLYSQCNETKKWGKEERNWSLLADTSIYLKNPK